MARHGDRVQQLQTWAHEEESSLASELATGGRDNKLSTGPGSVPGTGTAGFRCDCARLGKAFLRSAICLVLCDTGGPMKLPVMLRVLMGWLAIRLEGGERLQRPDVGVQGATPLRQRTGELG